MKKNLKTSKRNLILLKRKHLIPLKKNKIMKQIMSKFLFVKILNNKLIKLQKSYFSEHELYELGSYPSKSISNNKVRNKLFCRNFSFLKSKKIGKKDLFFWMLILDYYCQLNQLFL